MSIEKSADARGITDTDVYLSTIVLACWQCTGAMPKSHFPIILVPYDSSVQQNSCFEVPATQVLSLMDLAQFYRKRVHKSNALSLDQRYIQSKRITTVKIFDESKDQNPVAYNCLKLSTLQEFHNHGFKITLTYSSHENIKTVLHVVDKIVLCTEEFLLYGDATLVSSECFSSYLPSSQASLSMQRKRDIAVIGSGIFGMVCTL